MPTITGFSAYSEVSILEHHFRNTSMPPPPPTLHVALFTVLPDENGAGGVEPVGAGYGRLAKGTGAIGTGIGSDWTAPLAGKVYNAADLLWSVASPTAWGDIAGVGIFDAPSGGNLLYGGPADDVITIGVNDQYKIPAGALELEVGG